MAKLHSLLAVANTKRTALSVLMADSLNKFKKFDYFRGQHKTLKMLEDSPQNKATEQAAESFVALPTTVQETLAYMLPFWADYEDVLHQTNKTNQRAAADIVFRGAVLATSVPVDGLLGLEVRLDALRKLMAEMPTLPATTEWELNTAAGRPGAYKAKTPNVTVKTEKTVVANILYEATKEHPAQIEKIPQDKTVGTFTLQEFCGAATSQQKADVLAAIDELIVAVKDARMRANDIEADTDKIGGKIVQVILDQFKQ